MRTPLPVVLHMILVVAVCASCVARQDRTPVPGSSVGGTSTSEEPESSAPEEPQWAPQDGWLELVCMGSSYAQAPAYGSTPRRPARVMREIKGTGRFEWAEELDRKWDEQIDIPDAFSAGDAATVQIVGCAALGAEQTSPPCDYHSTTGTKSIPMHAMSYVFTVHEVKTGKVLTTVDLAGDTTCPLGFVGAPPDHLFATPTAQQYLDVMRPLVFGS